jgi:hypothetical protein
MTREILKAFEAIREFHPTICMVVFTNTGLWRYMDANSNSIWFDDAIDASVLEEAYDSVIEYPSFYHYKY